MLGIREVKHVKPVSTLVLLQRSGDLTIYKKILKICVKVKKIDTDRAKTCEHGRTCLFSALGLFHLIMCNARRRLDPQYTSSAVDA